MIKSFPRYTTEQARSASYCELLKGLKKGTKSEFKLYSEIPEILCSDFIPWLKRRKLVWNWVVEQGRLFVNSVVVDYKELAVVHVTTVERIAWTPTWTLGMAGTALFARFRFFETFRFAAPACTVLDTVMQCLNKRFLKLALNIKLN